MLVRLAILSFSPILIQNSYAIRPILKSTTPDSTSSEKVLGRQFDLESLDLNTTTLSELLSFFVCSIVLFYVRLSDIFCSLFKVRRNVIGCINHNLKSKPLLQGYPTTHIHLAFVDSKNVYPRGNRTQDLTFLKLCRYRYTSTRCYK